MKLDNIDVPREDVTAEQYRRFYDDLARRNLEHVRAGTAARQFGHAQELGVWHIPTVIHIYPLAADMLRALGYRSLEAGADIGCGTVTFFDFFPVRRAFAVDLVYDYCAFMHARHPFPVLQGDIECLPLADGSMDILIASDILEHVLSLDAALSEVRRILRPGGLLVAAFPWRQNLRTRLSGFAHVRAFDDANTEERFSDFEILGRQATEPRRGWLDEMIFVMRSG